MPQKVAPKHSDQVRMKQDLPKRYSQAESAGRVRENSEWWVMRVRLRIVSLAAVGGWA